MRRINYFAPFEHVPTSHENQLTRGLLVLLRYIPLSQVLVLDMLREGMKEDPKLPTITETDSPLEVWTQQGTLPSDSGFLLSVLLCDEVPAHLPPVRWVDRSPVYDGVMRWGDWTVLVEHKLRAEEEDLSQLNPAREEWDGTEGPELIPVPVTLRWGELLARLEKLTRIGVLSGIEEQLLDDFLEFVDFVHPRLGPYSHFGHCRGRPVLLRKRLELSVQRLAETTEMNAGQRRRRSAHLEVPGGIAQEIHLTASSQGRAWKVHLSVYPGDTVTQARRLYRNLDLERLEALREQGWLLQPNLHWGYISQHLDWAHTEVDVLDYIRVWLAGEIPIKRYDARPDILLPLVGDLESRRFINELDRRRIHEKFIETGRTHFNLCPGLALTWEWDDDEALELDDRSLFESRVLEKVTSAFEAWKEAPPVREQ